MDCLITPIFINKLYSNFRNKFAKDYSFMLYLLTFYRISRSGIIINYYPSRSLKKFNSP